MGESQGSQPVAEPVSARRLRVPRGSEADPLNLIQVMLAKGSVSIVCAYPGFSAAVLTYDRDAELV